MLKVNKVSKANDLNLRAYQLTKTEQLLVLSAISLIQPDDNDFKTYKIYVKDFMNLIETKDQSKYTELPKLTRGLMSKVIEIKKPHSLLHVTWFSSAEHKQGEGIIEIEFSPKLKPYLLNLKNNFVSYGLNQVSKLSSKYSIRIYELIKGNEFKHQKSVEFELGDFREMIGVEDEIYPKYSNFKQKVLIPAQSEINTLTDIGFNFEEIKTGRKVTRIKFKIMYPDNLKIESKGSLEKINDTNSSEETKLTDVELEALKLVLDESFSDIELKNIYDAARGNLEKIKEIYIYAKGKEVDSIVAYIIQILKDGFVKPKKNIPTTEKDFKEREYDYDDLERKLLGWDNLK